MVKITLILLIFVVSCQYPDIDTVPKFDSLNLSIEEIIDKCKNQNINKSEQEDCFKKINEINNRL